MGLLLPAGEKRDRFKRIQHRLSELSIQYRTNLREYKKVIWVTPKELEGVPVDEINVNALRKGRGGNQGKVMLDFKHGHSVPFMKYAKDGNARRRYAMEEANGSETTARLFRAVLILRDEAARILGYPDHATLRIQNNMAKTPAKMNEFLGNLRTRLKDGGKKETQRLLEHKKLDSEERGIPFNGELYTWDVEFYSHIAKQKEDDMGELAISQYFPADSTLTGMFKVFEHLLGFVFVELSKEDRARLSPTGKAEDIAWHEDVLIYSVWDDKEEGGGFCGYLYLDLYPRQGKYTHNANISLESGYMTKEGKRHYPVTVILCNLAKSPKIQRPLLKHLELKILFHELGHAVHNLASRTRYSQTHGPGGVTDFVEAPSQMLENWCWTPSVLKSLSRHRTTNATIPDDMVERLVGARNFNSATAALSQLRVGIFDMAVHTPTSNEAIRELNLGELWNQLRHDMSDIKGPEDVGLVKDWGNAYAQVSHLISGYDAGYYSYLYSLAISTDMFETFFKDDSMNAQQGRRYRHVVLERGGSIDEMEMLKEYLGREPRMEPLYRELRICS